MHYSSTMNLTAASASVVGKNMSLRGNRVVASTIARKVRLVSTNIEPVNSCDAAYWPYYPGACLERIETAGL